MGKVPDFIVLQSGAWRHLVEDKANIIAHRRHVPPSPVTVKKTLRRSYRESKD